MYKTHLNMSKLLYANSVEFAVYCTGRPEYRAETSALRVALWHPTQAKTLLLSSWLYKPHGPLPRNIRVASHETPIRSQANSPQKQQQKKEERVSLFRLSFIILLFSLMSVMSDEMGKHGYEHKSRVSFDSLMDGFCIGQRITNTPRPISVILPALVLCKEHLC